MGDSVDDASPRESPQTSERAEAATQPNPAPEVPESPSLPLERTEATGTCSEASSSESESDEGPNSTVPDESTKRELLNAIRDKGGNLEKVRSLTQQHPDLLR